MRESETDLVLDDAVVVEGDAEDESREEGACGR